jgi:hypothetical protein
MTRARTHAAAAASLALLALAGCSSGGSDESGGGSADTALEAPAPAAPADDAKSGGEQRDPLSNGSVDGSDGKAGRAPVQTRAIIATGTVTIVDDDLGEVRNNIDRLLGRYGGYVSDEATFNTADGTTSGSRLTLRVPFGHFSAVMDAFKTFTKVREAHTNAEDVTTEVIDVDSRVRTQELSLRRLGTFLRRTQDIDAMIRLESEIAEREAQLESLKAQQKYLSDQTSLGTITVSMQTPDAKPKKDDPLQGAGFFNGLDDGWNAMKDALLVAATVVGAVLPFGIVGALVGVPLWVVLRRRRRLAPVQPDVAA